MLPAHGLVHSVCNAASRLNWRYVDTGLPVSSGRVIAAALDVPPPAPDGSMPDRRATLRCNLFEQGCSAAVVDSIITHNWAASTSTGHDSAWRQWQRHCFEHLDDARRDNPSAADLVNFLQRVRDGDFSDKNVDTFSAEWVRKVRSTVSVTVSMWSGAGARIGEHPLVTSFIQALTNDDLTNRSRRRYRYDDTWDVQSVFDFVQHRLLSADFLTLRRSGGTPYILALRDLVIPLARILLCSRSADLKCVYRGVHSAQECVRFTRDDAGSVSDVAFRFYAPKQRRTMPTTQRGYTDWIIVAVVAADSGVPCFASLCGEYFQLTAALPSYDDAFFLGSYANAAHAGKFWGLSSDRLANVMRDTMRSAGVPPDFLPHSARHAGIAFQRGLPGMTDDDVMHRANMQAATYVRHYRRRVRSHAAGR